MILTCALFFVSHPVEGMIQQDTRYDCEEHEKEACREVVRRVRNDLFCKISMSLKFQLPPTQALTHLIEFPFGEVWGQYETQPTFLWPLGTWYRMVL